LRVIDDFLVNANGMIAIGKPSVLALDLLERFPQCKSLYDAMDDFPAFYAGFSRIALSRREGRIARRVGNIWVSSSELKKRWACHRDDVRLVNNGLDLAALPAVETPTPTASAKRTFGYVGTIGSWFDWHWVCTLAAARPQDEVCLVGPVFDSPTSKLPDNIALLPARDHVAALQAMGDFDVGLIPFKRNKLTASVDPIKYYEYRALSLPVISTNFGEMRWRSGTPGVFISQSASDAADLAESALHFERAPGCADAFALQNAWEARFDASRLFA
jgi:hypothetical protein